LPSQGKKKGNLALIRRNQILMAHNYYQQKIRQLAAKKHQKIITPTNLTFRKCLKKYRTVKNKI
jgi:hypothetical protein